MNNPIIPPMPPQIPVPNDKSKARAKKEAYGKWLDENRPDAPVQIPQASPKRPDSVTEEPAGEYSDRDDFSGFEYLVVVTYGAGYHENDWYQEFIHPAPARQLYDLLKSQVGVNNVIQSVEMKARTVGDWLHKYGTHAQGEVGK
ncbi:hypothetical protein PBI_KAMPE_90 [Gordonia phage Kampe]|uniref:Uncharacterized protein n=3 Tax=Gordonia phage Orchid TaxID=1838075 RepID=A0A160DH84_9CAUD|nr:hypothetical protein BH761_gp089 [Gordonia phage Orchid]ANA87324.1 hypothetical protein PBI_PATRICKSTAR_90 [Gordonia phage PatrickStar]ANA87435.1 hypothetical protein PBI_ORCHID_89 [Gordonia phage Orchid]ANA87550.1 hypothetical protein PBI_KAMPE_90 [Gordonia phage Kampe]